MKKLLRKLLFLTMLFALVGCGDIATNLVGLPASSLMAQTNQTFLAVQFLNPDTVIACGTTGVMARSTDAGATWTLLNSGTTSTFNSLSLNGFMGANLSGVGYAYSTSNGGLNWSAIANFSFGVQGIAFPTASFGTVAGSTGHISSSTDGGVTWTARTSGTQSNFYAISRPTVGTAFASAFSDSIFKSTDSMATWTKQATGAANPFYAIYAQSATVVTAVGQNNSVAHTTDGGTTWTLQTVSGAPSTIIWRGVTFTDANNGVIVGQGGGVARTTNGGTAWTYTSQPAATLYGVSFTGSNTGIIVGEQGMILRTTNAGSTWSQVSIGTISTAPLAPVLISPANGATAVSTNPTLSWNASTGAATYRIQVSTSSTFSTTVLDDSTLIGTSDAISGLTSNTVYYWHVNAKNATGTSPYSTTFSFTTISSTDLAPDFSVSPTSLSFGKTPLSTDVNATLTVTNVGGGTLTVSNIASDNSVFTVKSPTSFSLNGDESSVVLIDFHPAKTQKYNGHITFTFNATGSPKVVSVSGTGTRK